jgi:hypothetical protein
MACHGNYAAETASLLPQHLRGKDRAEFEYRTDIVANINGNVLLLTPLQQHL